MSGPPSVLVVGDVIDDVFVRIEHEIRLDTDTDADISLQPGGSAANTACWLGHLGVDVEFHGRVAKRDISRHEWEFSHFGVNAHLQPDPHQHTGTIVVIVQGPSRTMLTDRGAHLDVEVSGLCHRATEIPRVLHLTGYSFFHRATVDDLVELMDRARSGGTSVVLDCSSAGFLADHGEQWWWDIAAHATHLKSNADEALFLTGCEPLQAAKAFSERGLVGIVTMAEQGAAWCEPGGTPQHLPAEPLGPRGRVDPTGAGDSFSAGLISGLIDGQGLDVSVRRGLQVSAQAVSQRGARP